jgi:hypothetical protein
MKRNYNQVIFNEINYDMEKIKDRNRSNNESLTWIFDSFIKNDIKLRVEFDSVLGQCGLEYCRNNSIKYISNNTIIIALKLLNRYKLLYPRQINKTLRDFGCNVRIIDYNMDDGDRRDFDIVEI